MRCWGKAGCSCLDTRSHSRVVNTRLCYHRCKLISTDIDQQCIFLHLFLRLTRFTFCILLSPWLYTWRGLQIYPKASPPLWAPRHWHLAHSELCSQGFCSNSLYKTCGSSESLGKKAPMWKATVTICTLDIIS